MKRILIIEDDEILRGELARLLQNAGYDAVQMTDFQDAAAQMTAARASSAAENNCGIRKKIPHHRICRR